MKTYEKILKKCSTIPWYVIPSDKNWVKEYTSLVIMRDVLKKLNPKYPKLISERFSEK
jgi:polyphosphate kinase 2 (PPK2 family)